MTLADVNVKLQLALPAGWTKEDIEDELNDLLTAFQEGLNVSHRALVESTVEVVWVNADPFAPFPLPLAMR